MRKKIYPLFLCCSMFLLVFVSCDATKDEESITSMQTTFSQSNSEPNDTDPYVITQTAADDLNQNSDLLGYTLLEPYTGSGLGSPLGHILDGDEIIGEYVILPYQNMDRVTEISLQTPNGHLYGFSVGDDYAPLADLLEGKDFSVEENPRGYPLHRRGYLAVTVSVTGEGENALIEAIHVSAHDPEAPDV